MCACCGSLYSLCFLFSNNNALGARDGSIFRVCWKDSTHALSSGAKGIAWKPAVQQQHAGGSLLHCALRCWWWVLRRIKLRRMKEGGSDA